MGKKHPTAVDTAVLPPEMDLATRAKLADDRLATLRMKLRATLLEGGSTAAVRAAISLGEAEVGEVARLLAEAAEEAAEQVEMQFDLLAEDLELTTTARLNAQLSAIPIIDGDDAMTTISKTHEAAIGDAAAVVVRAQAEADRAGAALRDASAVDAGVRARLKALADARAAIVARRHAGDPRVDDGADLTLIVADQEGLEAELVETGHALSERGTEARAANTALAAAQVGLAQAERAALRDTLIERASALDTALVATIAELAAVSPPGRPVWGATPALRDRIRALAIQRHEM